jgi:acylphosphatase
VRGRVQGVGFRYFVLREARRLRLEGWVANEPDGAVRCVAEGGPAALEAFIEQLRIGPMGARVDDVRVAWHAAHGGLGEFHVRAGWHAGD